MIIKIKNYPRISPHINNHNLTTPTLKIIDKRNDINDKYKIINQLIFYATIENNAYGSIMTNITMVV